MQPSMFNVRVPLDGRNDVFLMNTFTDAQLIVSPEVAALLDRVGTRRRRTSRTTSARRSTPLVENGFIVASRDAERQALEEYLHRRARGHASSCA